MKKLKKPDFFDLTVNEVFKYTLLAFRKHMSLLRGNFLHCLSSVGKCACLIGAFLIFSDLRIHDEVVSWVKKVQISVGKAGDQILEDLRCKSQAGIQGTRFIGNEEFLRTISPDKIGFLQEPEIKFSIEDYSLDLVTPVTNLKPNAEVKC